MFEIKEKYPPYITTDLLMTIFNINIVVLGNIFFSLNISLNVQCIKSLTERNQFCALYKLKDP